MPDHNSSRGLRMWKGVPRCRSTDQPHFLGIFQSDLLSHVLTGVS